MSHAGKTSLLRTILYGLASALLYYLLYAYSEPILNLSRQGHWAFIIPVGIAFIFSYVHGHFTGYFWERMGMTAKSGQ